MNSKACTTHARTLCMWQRISLDLPTNVIESSGAKDKKPLVKYIHNNTWHNNNSTSGNNNTQRPKQCAARRDCGAALTRAGSMLLGGDSVWVRIFLRNTGRKCKLFAMQNAYANISRFLHRAQTYTHTQLYTIGCVFYILMLPFRLVFSLFLLVVLVYLDSLAFGSIGDLILQWTCECVCVKGVRIFWTKNLYRHLLSRYFIKICSFFLGGGR